MNGGRRSPFWIASPMRRACACAPPVRGGHTRPTLAPISASCDLATREACPSACKKKASPRGELMIGTDIDLALQSATALTAALRERQISSSELLHHFRARIERLNPTVNAVVTLDEGAFERATDAD